MVTHAFGKGCCLQNLGAVNACCRLDTGNLEVSFCEGSGFVGNYGVELCEKLKVVGALYEDSACTGGSDSPEEGKRNGDHESAGTGHNQEGAGAVEPGCGIMGDQRRHYRKGDGGIHNDRGVNPRESGDEILGF